MAKSPTLHDLAKAAKVSPATVSRVVANNPAVGQDIRRQVYRAAEKLGIDLEARRRGQPHALAFLLANRDVLHSFQARVLLGAENYCAQHNWELLFISFRYAPETPPESLHLPQLLSLNTLARAVILGGTNYPNLFQALETRRLPFSVLGNNIIGEWKPVHGDAAYSDDISGAKDVTAHLIAKGHRAIVYIGNRELPWFNRCARGYEMAMSAAGLAPRSIDMRSDGSQLGYLATKSILSKYPDLTAIVAGADPVAAGVYDALREMKITIPDQVSVVGVNDTQGELLYPPLTTVREFPEELGRHLAEFALQRVRKPDLSPQELTIPTQLVARASVAPPLTVAVD